MLYIKKLLFICLFFSLTSCLDTKPDDPNNLGLVTKLPKGEYVIWNYGSRHIVKCETSDGKFYYLNDVHFRENGIDARDAHEFHYKTTVKIR